MTLRQLIKQTVGEITFCAEEGKTVNWAALDYNIELFDYENQQSFLSKDALVHEGCRSIEIG